MSCHVYTTWGAYTVPAIIIGTVNTTCGYNMYLLIYDMWLSQYTDTDSNTTCGLKSS